LTILYCSTNRLCRCGAPVKNLAHSASLQLLDKIAPSKFGIKHLGHQGERKVAPSSVCLPLGAHSRGTK
jgi:hypothetical protein